MSSSSCPDPESIGSSPFLKETGTSQNRCPPESATSKDNWKKVQADFSTTKSTPFWILNPPLENASHSSVQPPIVNSQDHKLLGTMFGKKKQELPTRNSSLENSPCAAKSQRTGSRSLKVPKQVTLMPSPVMYLFAVTTNCVQSAMTIQNRWINCDPVLSTGDLQVQGNRGVLGMRQGWRLTLKILAPNGGMDTLITLTSSLTNSEAALISRTSSAGLIGIRYEWKLKVNPCLCEHPEYGLHQTFRPPCGTPISTQKHCRPS